MKRFWFLTLVLFLSACSHTGTYKHSGSIHVEKSVAIGENLRANRYSDIYFAPQPSEKDWEKLKAQGFTHVINLRSDEEYDEQKEKSKMESLKLNYTQVPIRANEELTKSTVDLVTQSVMAHRKKGKTLIHCLTGQRAAFWAGAHFYQDHNQSADEALQTAHDLGLNNPHLVKTLKNFFSENKK